MSGWKEMNGSYLVEIVSASIPDMLTAVARSQIELWDVHYIDELTLRTRIGREQYEELEKLLGKRGEHCRISGRRGFYWRFRGLLKRPVLLVGLLVLLVASLYLPTRVLFVQVEGNEKVSTYQILEHAETCGIRMGASRSAVRSEKMKNSLLMRIPELKWAGINTKGCSAVISVTEREIPIETEISVVPRRIVAERDGVIESITTTKGTARCAVGQAVTKGQVLVSPYADCGISIKLTQVEAEIMALTNRKLLLKIQQPTACFGTESEEHTSLSLLIGKKQIKIYNGSGNYGGICDKIYKEKYLTLPGGFQIPVALVVETTVCYAPKVTETQWQPDIPGLEAFAESYLRSVMVSGKILSGETQTIAEEGGVAMEGRYSCLEMIGKLQDEEIVRNEQRD